MLRLTRSVALDGHARRDASSPSACDWRTGEEGERLAGPKPLTVCPLVTKIYCERSQYECKRSNLSLQMRVSKNSKVFCWSESQSQLTILGTRGTRKRRPLHLISRAFFPRAIISTRQRLPNFPDGCHEILRDDSTYNTMI